MMLARARTTALARRAFSSSRGGDELFRVHGALTELKPGELPAVGVEAWLSHGFSLSDTRQFAALAGDDNPIHADAQAAGQPRPVVQGLLSGGLFATIFGRAVPGAVYVSQELRWRQPLLVDERVTAHIRVVRVRRRFVDCETRCTKEADGSVVVEGRATVLLPKQD